MRSIDLSLHLSDLLHYLADFYSPIGRPSIDPELMIRMLIVGYCYGIRSERRLCEEAHLNLTNRWFCRLWLEDEVPNHSTYSKIRHNRFRDSDLFRWLFNEVLRRCIYAGLPSQKGTSVEVKSSCATWPKETSSSLTATIVLYRCRDPVIDSYVLYDQDVPGSLSNHRHERGVSWLSSRTSPTL